MIRSGSVTLCSEVTLKFVSRDGSSCFFGCFSVAFSIILRRLARDVGR